MKKNLKKLLGSAVAVLLLVAMTVLGGGDGSEASHSSSVSGTAQSYSQTVDASQTTQLPDDGDDLAADSTVQSTPVASTPAQTDEVEHPANSPPTLDEHGSYDSKEEVALYIHLYGRLPDNYLSKKEAEALGWSGGSVEKYAPGKCIGGSRFGNYEGLLPDAPGRSWTECDIDTLGQKSRGAKRIVFSNDGLIYYTGDHYESFELLYGEG